MKRTRAAVVGISIAVAIILAVTISIVARRSRPEALARPDPFGTTQEAWAALNPTSRAFYDENPKKYQPPVRDMLVRVNVTNGKFRGAPGELNAFLDMIESTDADRASARRLDPVDARSLQAVPLATIARAWRWAGPYRDGSVEHRALRAAIPRCDSPDRMIAIEAAFVVRVVVEKWSKPGVANDLPPADAVACVERLRQRPDLWTASQAMIDGADGKDIQPGTPPPPPVSTPTPPPPPPSSGRG